MIVVTVTIAAISLLRAVSTVGQPFAGFFFGPNLLVAINQRAVWPGIEKGLHSLDRIAAVDGVQISKAEELLDRVKSSKVGESLIYRIDRGGEMRTIAVPVTTYSIADFVIGFLAPFSLGLLFLAFGAILYFAQPWAKGSLLYLTICCVVATFCLSIYEAYTTFTLFRITLLYPLIGALSVHLFSIFPRALIYRPRVRMTVYALYLFAFALVLWRQIAAAEVTESVFLSRLSSVYVLIVLTVDILLLVRGYQRAPNQAIRDRIKVIATGLAITSSVVAVWSLNFILETRPFYLDEGVLLASAFPLFMGYAVLRRNIFGLDRFIRLSLSYGIAGAIVLALYIMAVGLVRSFLPNLADSRYAGWLFVSLAVAGAILFNQVRKQINLLVHRVLFRNEYDLATAFSSLDQSLSKNLPMDEIANRVGRTVTELFDVQRAAFLWFESSLTGELLGRSFRWKKIPDWEAWRSIFESENFLTYLIEQRRPCEVVEMIHSEPGRYQQSMALLQAHEIEVLLPLLSGDQLLGILLLGRKNSLERFDSADLRILRPMAVRLGMSLANAELSAQVDRKARLAAIGQMASMMIHDIKNPLSTIKSAAGSVKRRFREGEHSHELITIIEDEVERMDRKVADILSFAKPMGLRLEKVSLESVIREAVKRVLPSFQTSNIQLEVMTDGANVEFEMDQDQIRRAIENLLINAKEATPPNGKVMLRTNSPSNQDISEHILIQIEDSGSGMKKEIRERVFQPFFTTKSGGTGLGLAIVKQVVIDHGGEIDVESKENFGSRFQIRLPQRRMEN